MHIALLGLGLIGGSIAQALRGAAGWTVTAWSPRGRGPGAARDAGAIDAQAGSLADAVAAADLVVLAAPPLACLELIPQVAGHVRPGVTVTDVASTKARITDVAATAGLPFVGGHPMAGRERSGFEAADPTLFQGRPWVITEAVAGGDPAAVRALAEACRGVPLHLTAVEHDRAVAAISHLPLVAAVALVESVLGGPGDPEPADAAAVLRLAASGWRDMTRLARGDAEMGAGILATNAEPVAERLRAYRDRIDAWLAALETGEVDAAELRAWFEAARTR